MERTANGDGQAMGRAIVYPAVELEKGHCWRPRLDNEFPITITFFRVSMSRHLHDHRAKQPAQRVRPEVAAAVFFPGEVARLLGLENIEYDQLRRLFLLARLLRGEPHPGR